MTPSRAILTATLIAYLIGSTAGLAVYPRVSADEPWIAAAPYKLATQGILGSDLFTGLGGMERRHYQHMPVYPLLEAAVFKVFDVGVAQMRLLSVAFGFLLLVAAFVVGRFIGDERVGAAAVLLLVVVRLADGGEATGILLLDRARVNRYDIAVPVFGLLAFYAFMRAERDRQSQDYVAAGLLSALSSLSHLYGVFWQVILAGLLVARAGRPVVREPASWLVTIGFLVPWLPWAAFVATGWTDYLVQMRTVSERFEIFSPGFYSANVLYSDGPISLHWLIETIRGLPARRIGAWTSLIGLPAAVVAMVCHTRARSQHPVRLLAIVGVSQLTLFVVLLQVKTITYMIALWPLGALSLAWLGVWLWDKGRRSVRVGLVLLATAIAIEGGARFAHARTVASRMTAYDWFTSEVARCIPPGSLVLGLQHYWLGLRQFAYRTWLLPLFMTNPRFTDTPLPFAAALERISPDVILIDRFISEMFDLTANPSDPLHRLSVDFNAFAASNRLSPACVVRDRTYGVMQVYLVTRNRVRVQ